MNKLTHARLTELLNYNPDTGVFTWRVYRGRTAKAGFVAGKLHSSGYRNIKIDGRHYQAARLAWMYVHGDFPIGEMDHINRSRDDNRITNLRIASRRENSINRGISSRNTSGSIGVTLHKPSGKWMVKIKVNGRYKELGKYRDFEFADLVSSEARDKFHGIFSPIVQEAQ